MVFVSEHTQQSILEQHRLWLVDDGGHRADFTDADLAGANLAGADLAGADLAGAELYARKIAALVATLMRGDGFGFISFRMTDGSIVIRAGCRTKTLPEYREHIKSYDDEAKRVETADILDFIERRAAS